MKQHIYRSRKFYFEPSTTHLLKRWWHKLLFWRSYEYPEFKLKINIKVDNIAGWPEQGMVYIDDGSVPPALYAFEKGKSEGNNPTPVYITKYKNRIKLSKKVLKEILND